MPAFYWMRDQLRVLLRVWKLPLVWLLIAIQIFLVADNYIVGHLRNLPRSVGLLASDRSGVRVFGEEGFAFMAFVRDEVPEDATLVIPSRRPIGERKIEGIWHGLGVMQFYLMPRSILQCPCQYKEAYCFECLKKEENYILSIADFPPVEAELDRKIFVPYDGEGANFLGIYKPMTEGAE
jgi:hypothetical protein